jgi:hypothetical protein
MDRIQLKRLICHSRLGLANIDPRKNVSLGRLGLGQVLDADDPHIFKVNSEVDGCWWSKQKQIETNPRYYEIWTEDSTTVIMHDDDHARWW